MLNGQAELDLLFSQLAVPSQQLTAQIEELLGKSQQYAGAERRTAERYQLAQPIVAVPIDESRAAGEAFAAVTRDISASGMAIYHSQPVYEPYLAVQWSTENGDLFRVLLEIVRCRPVSPFFYELAGTFITQPDQRG